MNLVDYLLIGVIAAVVIWAIRTCIRDHAAGKSCSGDCTHCNRRCGK